VFNGGTMEAYKTNISAIRSAAALAGGDMVWFNQAGVPDALRMML
jgi:hypothetical protein